MEDTIYEIDFQDDEAQVSEELESSSALLVKAENVVTNLESLITRLQGKKEIDRTTASTIRTLTTGMKSMDAHFTKYPVNSYTALASPTNLKPTLEGLVGNLVTATASVIKAIFKFIYDLFKSIFGSKQRKERDLTEVQRTLKVEVKELERSSAKGTKEALTDQTSREFNTVFDMINALPPLASRVGIRERFSEDSKVLGGYSVREFVTALCKTEQDFIVDATAYIDELEHILRINDRGEAAAAYLDAKIASIKSDGVQYRGQGFLENSSDDRFNSAFGLTARNAFVSASKRLASENSIRVDKGTLNLAGYIANLSISLGTSGLSTVSFVPADKYTALEDKIKGIEKRLKEVGGDRFNQLDNGLNWIVSECRNVTEACNEMESLINQVRISVGRSTAVIRMYRKLNV